MRLTAKLVAILVVAITILFALDGYYSFQREVQRLEGFRENRRLTGLLFGKMLQDVPLVERQRHLDELINDVNRRQLPVRLRLVLLQTATDKAGLLSADKKARRAVLPDEVVSRHDVDADGRGWLHTYVGLIVPVRHASGRHETCPAVLEISEPCPHPDKQTGVLVRRMLTMTGLMVLVGGIAVYFLGTEMVGRPLDRLIEKTRRVGKGDLSGPLHLRGHDELGEVAEAFNAMCDQLAESREKALAEEAARMATMEQLRHANRLRTVGGLASGVAHELGTPLSVVSGRAGLIASGKLAPAEITESAATIKAESQRMTTIIRQLLDFARRNSPQKTHVDLRQIVSQTMALLESLARKQNVTFRRTDPDDAVTARVDAGQIQQVLTNLIINGIQSMPDGGQIDVRICRQHAQPPADHSGAAGPFLCIQVQDDGVGISDADREHLFEPFFTTKGVGEGTGLGLSIAYGIVQEHGGWIDVQSAPGKGSCFSVYLPAEGES